MAPPPAHLVAAFPTGHDVAGAIASTKTLHVLEARVVTAEQRSLPAWAGTGWAAL